MSYEPDTSHPRFARPTLVPPLRTIRLSIYFFIYLLSLSISLSRSRPLIHRDMVLFVLPVASLVDVRLYNNNNNVNPCRRDFLPLLRVLRVLIRHISALFLFLSRSASKSFSQQDRCGWWRGKRTGMEGFRPLCGDNSSYTRYPEDSRMKS